MSDETDKTNPAAPTQGNAATQPAASSTSAPTIGRTDAGLRREVSVSYEGPLPLPRAMADYEAILPGSAERIMRMAEREQEHEHHVERQLLEIKHRGQRVATRLTTVGMVGAIILLALGKEIGALCSLLIALVPLLTALASGRFNKPQVHLHDTAQPPH